MICVPRHYSRADLEIIVPISNTNTQSLHPHITSPKLLTLRSLESQLLSPKMGIFTKSSASSEAPIQEMSIHNAAPRLTNTPHPPILFSNQSSSTSAVDPPPPYNDPSEKNPGFCQNAFRERQENKLPGGGMTAREYFAPCTACGYRSRDDFAIPASYKNGWLDWVDPSVNFRWESHVCSNSTDSQSDEKKEEVAEQAGRWSGREQLACWICWEFDNKWTGGMDTKNWYTHMRRHFFVEGYRICKGAKGGMQRRRNCGVGAGCPKVHS